MEKKLNDRTWNFHELLENNNLVLSVKESVLKQARLILLVQDAEDCI